MAITVDKANIGTFTNDGSSSTTVLTTNQTVAAGATIIVAFGGFTGGVSNLTSIAGGGLTWTVDKMAGQTTNWSCGMGSAYAPSGLASGSTITGTMTGGAWASRSAGAMSFLGIHTTARIDGTPPAEISTTSGPAAWATTATTIADGSVLVGICHGANTASSHTAAAGSTEAWEAFDVVDTYGTVMVYRIEATGGSFTVGGTWGISGENKRIAVAYLTDEPPPPADETLFLVRNALRLR